MGIPLPTGGTDSPTGDNTDKTNGTDKAKDESTFGWFLLVMCLASIAYLIFITGRWETYINSQWTLYHKLRCDSFWKWLACAIRGIWLLFETFIQQFLHWMAVGFVLINIAAIYKSIHGVVEPSDAGSGEPSPPVPPSP